MAESYQFLPRTCHNGYIYTIYDKIVKYIFALLGIVQPHLLTEVVENSKFILMNPGTKIFHLRRERNWNQKQLGQKLGILANQVSRLERGHRVPSATILEKLVAVFGVTRDYLLDESKDYFPPRNGDITSPHPYRDTGSTLPTKTAPLPYSEQIISGDLLHAVQEDLGEYHVLRHLWGPNRYVLKVEGDSMYPNLKKGDLLLVENVNDGKPADYSGKICTILFNGESTLKRVFVSAEGEIQLKPDNPYTPIITVTPSDKLIIQGWVMAIVERRNP